MIDDLARRSRLRTQPAILESGEPRMIVLNGVRHVYRVGSQGVRAVDGVDLSVESGTVTCLLGPSGSGKSTLLHLIGGVEPCQEGQIAVDDWQVSQLSAAELAR